MNDEIKSLEEDRKQLLTLINQLQKEKDSLIGALTLSRQKYNNDKARYRRKYKKIRKNWNSLRECIIGVIEGAREELNTIIHTTDIGTKDGLKYVNQCSREFDVIRKNLEIVLDKMNELEGEKNEIN